MGAAKQNKKLDLNEKVNTVLGRANNLPILDSSTCSGKRCDHGDLDDKCMCICDDGYTEHIVTRALKKKLKKKKKRKRAQVSSTDSRALASPRASEASFK